MTDSEIVKTIRTGLELTQEQIGVALGTDPAVVAAWEEGTAKPEEKSWRGLLVLCAEVLYLSQRIKERSFELKALAARLNAMMAAQDNPPPPLGDED